VKSFLFKLGERNVNGNKKSENILKDLGKYLYILFMHIQVKYNQPRSINYPPKMDEQKIT